MATDSNTIGIRSPGRPLSLSEREVGTVRGMLLSKKTLKAIHEATRIPYTTVRRYAKKLEQEALDAQKESPVAVTNGANDQTAGNDDETAIDSQLTPA